MVMRMMMMMMMMMMVMMMMMLTVRGGQDRAAQALAARGRHGVCQAAQGVGLPRPQVPCLFI